VKSLKWQIKATMSLGMITLLAGLLAHLALLDIYHLEPDVTLEWTVLQVCALIFLGFICLTLATLRQALKTLPE
jgi:hypothetical protein